MEQKTLKHVGRIAVALVGAYLIVDSLYEYGGMGALGISPSETAGREFVFPGQSGWTVGQTVFTAIGVALLIVAWKYGNKV